MKQKAVKYIIYQHPFITAQDTQDEWMLVFIIVAALNIIGAVVFCIFASGEVQDWALPAKHSSDCQFVSVVTVTVSGTDALPPVRKEDNAVGGVTAKETDSVYQRVVAGDQRSED